MNPDILDTLVVVFKGDASHYQKTIQNVIALTKSAEQQLTALSSQASKVRNQLAEIKSTAESASNTLSATSPTIPTGPSGVPSPGGVSVAIEDATKAREAAWEAAAEAVNATSAVQSAAESAVQSVTSTAAASADAVSQASQQASRETAAAAQQASSAASQASQATATEATSAANTAQRAGNQAAQSMGQVVVQVSGMNSRMQSLVNTLLRIEFWSAAAGVIQWGAQLSVQAYAFSLWVSGLSDAKEKAEALNTSLRDMRDLQQNSVMSRINSLQGETRTDFIESEIAKTELNLRGQAQYAIEAQRRVDELNTTWRSWTGNKVLDEAKTALKEADEQVKQTQKHLNELNKELRGDKEAESLKLSNDIEQMNLSLEKQIAIFGQAGTASQVYDLRMRGATEEQIAKLQELDSQLQAMQKNKGIDDLTKQWQMQADTVGMTSRQIEIYKASLDDATKSRVPELQAIDAQLTQQEQQQEQQQKLEQQRQAVADLAVEWQRQADTVGMTARQIEIYNASLQGMDTTKLKELDAVLSAQEKSAELTGNIDRLTESLQMQAETFGLTSTEAELYRLRLAGATEEQLKAAEAAAAAVKAQTEQQKLQQMANSLIEKHKSPLDKFMEAQAELEKLFNANKIPLEVYNAELKELQEKFDKENERETPQTPSNTPSLAMNDIKSIQAGTQEALLEMMEWSSKFSSQGEIPTSAAPSAQGGMLAQSAASSSALHPAVQSSIGDSSAVAVLGRIETGINRLIDKDPISLGMIS